MPKRTSAADHTTVRVTIVTLDTHLASAAERARRSLLPEIPGLELTVHAASEWADDPHALGRCIEAISAAHVIFVSMLFMEEHFQPVMPALSARRDHCDALVACMSAGEVMRLTRVGRFSMSGGDKGPMALLKRLRGSSKKKHDASAGERQMRTLRRIPKILRFIPGPAQDVRAYFIALQYWLAGSERNIANLVRMLVDRYASAERQAIRGTLVVEPPVEYPEIGVYHPALRERMTSRPEKLPAPQGKARGTVGLLVMRSYVLAGNAGHYDGVIAALEARGLKVIPAFASGLDARPAIERFFLVNGRPTIDVLVSLTGFPLVGGPAYNDARAAEDIMARLDVPHIAAQPLEFQTIEQWSAGERGLMPVEAAMMVAIPELDGSTGPIVFGGRSAASGTAADRDMQAHAERATMLAARIERLVTLKRTPIADRRVGVVLFSFPPNAGAAGTAMHLSVFASLHNTLRSMRAAGYTVDVPASVDALRDRLIAGNAERFGSGANVHVRIQADDHVRREDWLGEIEAQWGPAPGKHQSDGRSIFVLGERFGNVFVGIQPSMGYEGDPMRLLFAGGFAPTHAFSAFYRYLREDFNAHALLHFGTHGALEFMPGKQSGLSGACWPDRLIGDLPHFYLYASNNPSEGMLAKRRASATLISYLTPPITSAGLYRGLVDLKASIDRWRSSLPDDEERPHIAELVQAQAAELELVAAEPAWGAAAEAQITQLAARVLELECTLIPHGLHVVGSPPARQARIDLLTALAEASHGIALPETAIAAIVDDKDSPEIAAAVAATPVAIPAEVDVATVIADLTRIERLLRVDHELPAILRALDGRFIRPAPGGDLIRTPDILPTGRNVHGFDPYKMPSAYAVKSGERQAATMLARHASDGHAIPESIALVLWGTDNLKSEGAPVAQALALLGARARFDAYGRLAGTTLIPLEELGRPRIDIVVTLSGIFRDLLPLQTRVLAEAAYLAASADEPLELNFVRKHALAYQRAHGCDLETAALRIFGNADGTYGANVNHLIDNSRWDDEGELAETYSRRKCFAYGRDGKAARQSDLLNTMLADVQLAYQNLDSVELGVTTVDQYFDSLGGIASAIRRARGTYVPVYIGDATRGTPVVRTLDEQVQLETRTRTLNPKWSEAMLAHGYEGVHQIETHVTNTLGWSATTGQVSPWVYQRIAETYVLDEAMRNRLAELNPAASAKMAHRLIEAQQRRYWTPDDATLEALTEAGAELDDRLEGVYQGAAA